MFCVYKLLAVCLFSFGVLNSVHAAKCGGKEYEINQSFCCGATNHSNIRDGKIWKCCVGANTIYSNTEECCGSEIKTRSRYLGCCKTKFYNKSSELCCEESGKVLSKNEDIRCCGRRTFNYLRHLCCGNEHSLFDREANIACCGNGIYNKITHYCVQNDYAVRIGYERCRNQEYNRSSGNEICCDGGVINTRTLSGHTCCHRNTIFPQSDTHYCLEYKILQKNETLCGKEIINSNTKTCCNNVSHDKRYVQNACCGTSLIDTSTTGCCNDEVSYRLNGMQCCGAKVIRKNRQCCGGSPLRVKTHLCCNKTDQVKKQTPNQNQCCNNTPFDNKTAKCYKGNVVSLTDTFCGDKLMDANKDLCCDKINIFRNAKKTKKCCAGRAIKASCKCCPKGRRKCCPKKTKRKQKKLICREGKRWSTISNLVDAGVCLKQAFVVKKQRKIYKQKKQLLGRKENAFWKLDRSCGFIKKKRFAIVETSAGDFAMKFTKKNKHKLRDIKTCVSI